MVINKFALNKIFVFSLNRYRYRYIFYLKYMLLIHSVKFCGKVEVLSCRLLNLHLLAGVTPCTTTSVWWTWCGTRPSPGSSPPAQTATSTSGPEPSSCIVPLLRVVDPLWFNADPDPDPVPSPRFSWPKIEKILQLSNFLIFFDRNLKFTYL